MPRCSYLYRWHCGSVQVVGSLGLSPPGLGYVHVGFACILQLFGYLQLQVSEGNSPRKQLPQLLKLLKWGLVSSCQGSAEGAVMCVAL